MKKKLLCMFLCMIMMLTFVLSSCSIDSGDLETVEGDEDSTDESDRTPVTLKFWIPSDTAISEETVEAVEAALNEYLKSNFTTAIELAIYEKDEYEQKVTEVITSIEQKAEEEAAAKKAYREWLKEMRKQGISVESTEAVTEDATTDVDTIKNEWGINELKYPSTSEDQFDIFLITDYDMYLDLAERDALSELDTALSGTSKVLKSYINPIFFTAAKFNGTTYAIPNNHGLGEGKWLLLNKELLEKYYYDADTIAKACAGSTLAGAEEFIRDIQKYENTSEITPLLSWTEPAGMYYWSLDGEWSALASLVKATDDYSSAGNIASIFKNSVYKSNFKLMKGLEEDGLIAEDPANCELFAVGVVDGTYGEVSAQYGEEYYISEYQAPMISQNDLFAGAFAVSSYTEDFDRAMEVITALNTVTELRDILQYGAPGVHFEYSETGEVVRLNDDYTMNPLYTGNTFMLTLEEGADPQTWEYQKTSNLSAMFTPYVFCADLINDQNKQYYEELAKISADLYERMKNTSLEDADTFFSEANAELAESDAFNKLADGTWEFGTAYIYNTFYTENFAPVTEE